jgi:hypothetical protein
MGGLSRSFRGSLIAMQVSTLTLFLFSLIAVGTVTDAAMGADAVRIEVQYTELQVEVGPLSPISNTFFTMR